jgi:hypothetical protein
MIMARYMTFRESSNHHQNQGISQISLSVEYSKSQLDVNWDSGIKVSIFKEFPTHLGDLSITSFTMPIQ